MKATLSRGVRIFAWLTALSVFMAACGPATTAPGTAAPAAPSKALGTVTYRMEGDWAHLDVLGRQAGGGLQTALLVDSLYDALIIIGPDPKDPTKPTLLPYLATKWEATPSKITFTMRTDATCPDGTKVNPTLVKQNMDFRVKQPISMANAYGPGPFTFEANDSANTFTINFGTPFTDGIYAFLNQKIACPQALANPDMLINGAAGSGPYQIVEAVHGDHFTMKRREDWKWGPSGITAKDIPEQIIYKVVTNETTVANLLLTGGLDVAKVGGVDVPRLLSEKSLINKKTTSFYNYTLIFSQDPVRVTADQKVREALVSAVDLNAWNQAANQGRGDISPSFIMPKADCFDPKTQDLRVKDPNPEKARKVLTDAGWSVGANGKLSKNGKPLTIVLVSSTVIGHGNGGEYLAAQWDKMGATVDARITGDFNTFLQRCTKGDFDACTTLYPFDQPNPNNALSVFIGRSIDDTPKGNNWTKSKNPAAEAAFAKATSTVGAERCAAWSTVQQELLKNFSILPTASPHIYWFSKGIEFFPGASRSNVLFFRKA